MVLDVRDKGRGTRIEFMVSSFSSMVECSNLYVNVYFAQVQIEKKLSIGVDLFYRTDRLRKPYIRCHTYLEIMNLEVVTTCVESWSFREKRKACLPGFPL